MEINSVIKNNDLGKEFYGWLINPLSRVRISRDGDISKGLLKPTYIRMLPLTISVILRDMIRRRHAGLIAYLKILIRMIEMTG